VLLPLLLLLPEPLFLPFPLPLPLPLSPLLEVGEGGGEAAGATHWFLGRWARRLLLLQRTPSS
jgi:hypothetical protein